MNANLFAHFQRAHPPDASPLLCDAAGAIVTYAGMEAATARLARLLARLGLRPGDRLTVQVRKSPAALWLYLACLRGGHVFHPLNDDYQREELAYLIGDAAPALAVCDPQQEPLFRSLLPPGARLLTLDAAGAGSLTDAAAVLSADFPITPRAATDLAILLYTSGTTGKPKGAMITHGNLASNAQTLVQAWGFTAADRLLHILPLYHAHGLFVGLGCTLMSGASLVLMPKFAAADVVARLGECSVLMGVPTHYARLLRENGLDHTTCGHVRLFVSGSAPLPPEVFSAFRARTGHDILERYGMTETGMNTSNPLHGERRPGSVGQALPGISVRIADAQGRPCPPGEIGEVEIRGPNVFAGYWQQPEQSARSFTADGYFRSGDLGSFDADGYLTIAGRSKDLIISGGLNVYPREVEIALDSLPGVAEAAVIGVAHPDFGEAVVAAIVPEPGADLTPADVITAMKAQLAGYKVPKQILLLPELPRNAMGKVAKNVLRERHARLFEPLEIRT